VTGGAGGAPAEFAQVLADGRALRIEFRWIAPERTARPLVVFLHEGLGSVAMWRDFPARLCDALDFRGLVYSRPGYGRSTPREPDERWPVDFMHRQARAVLPALFAALDIDADADPPWLFGHSDGGSIALLYASRFPRALCGAIVLAPHIRVEVISIASIEAALEAYRSTDLRSRLTRFHNDVDSAFLGWNDIWLDPAFAAWNIEAELAAIRCPVLALQGLDDQYGTLEQIRGIARKVPHTRLVEIARCAHSPHRDQPDRVIDEARQFVAQAAANGPAQPSRL